MELLYSFILKSLVALKPLAPGVAGAVLNGLIRHYTVVTRGVASLTWSMRLSSLLASVLIGAGTVYILQGVYEYHHSPPSARVLEAAFFVGAAGGLELILWLIGRAIKLVDIMEAELLKKATKGTKKP